MAFGGEAGFPSAGMGVVDMKGRKRDKRVRMIMIGNEPGEAGVLNLNGGQLYARFATRARRVWSFL